MTASDDSNLRQSLLPLLITFVAVLFVVSIIPAVAAQDQGNAGNVYTDAMFQQEGETGSLSCLDVSEEEVAQKINEVGIDRANRVLQENSHRIPNSVRNAMVGERVNIRIDSTYFSFVINENAQLERMKATKLSDPTIRAKTDCETVDKIVESDNREDALKSAIANDDITWKGLTTTSDVETSYGGKAVQSYTIVESGETGNSKDAVNGFQNGLLLK